MKKTMIRNVIETGKERKKVTVTGTEIEKEAVRRIDIEIVIEMATVKGTAPKSGAVTDTGTVIGPETEIGRETVTETGNTERGLGMLNKPRVFLNLLCSCRVKLN